MNHCNQAYEVRLEKNEWRLLVEKRSAFVAVAIFKHGDGANVSGFMRQI
jgi:hypothetical protein